MAAEPKPATPQDDPLDQSIGTEPITPPRDPETGRFLPSEPPAAPSHPSYLVQQARYFGLSDEEIEGVSTSILSQQVLRLNQMFQHAQGRQQAPEPVKPKKPPTLAEIRKKLELDDDLASYLEDLDSRASEAKEAKAHAARLEQELQRRDQQSAQKELVRGTQIIDAAFARMAKSDPRYKAIFGDGPASDYEKKANDPEWQCRLAAMKAAGIDPSAVEPATIIRQLKGAADLFLRSSPEPTHATPASPYAQPPAAKASNGISRDDWDRAGLARPSGHRGAEPALTGERLARENLARKLGVNGQQQQAGDDEILDGFPE